MESEFNDYIDALLGEIAAADSDGKQLESVYFGGGTPTVLAPDDLYRILLSLITRFGLSDDSEITLEANPGTVSRDSLDNLRQDGFNRLSLGVQSFDNSILDRIGRIHAADDARDAFAWGRGAGFGNISIDLMYALPNQTLTDWHRTLDSALSLSPNHISLYELTVEEGTVLAGLRDSRRIHLPDEDLQIEMYMEAIRILSSAGYEHYEISNFALPGCRSRHNQVYWRNEPYYGFGAGASGYIGGVRYANLKTPTDYIAGVKSGCAIATSEAVSGRRAMGETVMLGLRMLDGLDLSSFVQRYGVDISDVYRTELADFSSRGLIEKTPTSLRLTPSGLLIANEIAAEFL